MQKLGLLFLAIGLGALLRALMYQSIGTGVFGVVAIGFALLLFRE